ncbi:TPA: hypothetical protein EYO63_17445 [Candidatus Poribacteria bacterium]|nr:hypothetical protein [Candidatus Poribacteria bacterium]
MQNTAPFNTDVPEYQPSREGPIYPAIVRRYPCQEDVVSALASQGLRSLTWKIQQPDSSMVWTSVKLVMPMQIDVYNAQEDYVDMRVATRLPACNVALSESVMRVFRDTSLTLNGKVFNEVNYYRDVLDACYRGVGPQSYGANHSLKPVVTRALRSRNANQTVAVRIPGGGASQDYVRIDDIKNFITSNNESLLDNNGPFLERARLWQDGLWSDGTVWSGDVSSYLEVGPFQARARKGNTAVPYIQDFHLKLNFIQNESRYDQLRHHKWTGGSVLEKAIRKGRVVAPFLLEFGTVANMHITGERIDATGNFLSGIRTFFTAKPYLEVTYTKFLDPMRSSYLLRCYERQYMTSLPRFKLPHNQWGGGTYYNSPVTARVTSRLLSYPTKIYLYAEVADEWKGAFLFGGVRRSCQLTNIHCRINQRPDVIYNPSQEECFETFQRHTNSSLEYGAWSKAPIYVFTPSDLRQSDMYANDARITWMEWDAEVRLTQLENQEQGTALGTQAITASGYIRSERDEIQTYGAGQSDWGNNGETVEVRCDPRQVNVRHTDAALTVQLFAQHDENSSHDLRINFSNAEHAVLGKPLVQMVYSNSYTGSDVATDSNMDITLTSVTSKAMQLDGYIWAIVETTGATKGAFKGGAIVWVPQSYRFVPDDAFKGGGEQTFVMPWAWVEEHHDAGDGTYSYNMHPAQVNYLKVAKGVISDNTAGARNGKKFGYAQAASDHDDVAPGPTGIRTDANGLRNMDVTFDANGDQAGQTYKKMGPSPFTKTAAKNDLFSCDDEKADATNPRWCCFAPPSSWLSSSEIKYIRFRADTHTTVGNVNSPVLVYAGGVVDTWQGQERVFITGAAANASVDAAEQTAYTSAQDPQPAWRVDGRRLATLVVDPEASDADIKFDYQLKVLYEYGNCQYEFTDQGMPTRVIDNLIPVGPSAGIPTF